MGTLFLQGLGIIVLLGIIAIIAIKCAISDMEDMKQ